MLHVQAAWHDQAPSCGIVWHVLMTIGQIISAQSLYQTAQQLASQKSHLARIVSCMMKGLANCMTVAVLVGHVYPS